MLKDDRLFVGTKQGHLLTYVIVKRSGDRKHDVQLLSYNKNFSKKAIQQLEVIAAYQLLISLSGVKNFHFICNSLNFLFY